LARADKRLARCAPGIETVRIGTAEQNRIWKAVTSLRWKCQWEGTDTQDKRWRVRAQQRTAHFPMNAEASGSF
jgi:hypothetical protein